MVVVIERVAAVALLAEGVVVVVVGRGSWDVGRGRGRGCGCDCGRRRVLVSLLLS